MGFINHIDFDFLPVAIALLGVIGCSGENLNPLAQDQIIPPPMTVIIKINDYCPLNFVDFFVKPMSFEIQKGVLQQDTNRDGLTDVEATAFGLSPFDQPASGITDFIGIEYLGLTAAQLPSIPVCPNANEASNGDVLTDCQANALGLLPLTNFDTAHRGFPNSLALYARLPLFDSDIATEDLAGDGIETIQKIKMDWPPDETYSSEDSLLTVSYSTNTYQSTSIPGVTCYDFTVTSPRAGVPNGDLYNLYFISASTSIWATGTVALGSANISSLSSTSGIVNGMYVSGVGIQPGSKVTAVSANTVTLSLSATAASTGTLLFMGPSGSGQNNLVTIPLIVPSATPNGATMEYEYYAL
jgi:hypothetical protein